MALPKSNRIGQRYGRLTVVEDLGVQVKEGHRRARHFWLCKCDCGGTAKRTSDNLAPKALVSCGCVSKEGLFRRLAPGKAAVNAIYHQYRQSAQHKDLCFTLSLEQFKSITAQLCHYCDAPPARIWKTPTGFVVVNGIDRKDNALGYTPLNSLPRCADCNYLKSDRSYESFLDKIKNIAKTRRLL